MRHTEPVIVYLWLHQCLNYMINKTIQLNGHAGNRHSQQFLRFQLIASLWTSVTILNAWLINRLWMQSLLFIDILKSVALSFVIQTEILTNVTDKMCIVLHISVTLIFWPFSDWEKQFYIWAALNHVGDIIVIYNTRVRDKTVIFYSWIQRWWTKWFSILCFLQIFSRTFEFQIEISWLKIWLNIFLLNWGFTTFWHNRKHEANPCYFLKNF